MPDWRPDVRAALAGLTIDPISEPDVVAELVHHLDDRYRAALDAGETAADARRLALDELADPGVLVAELTSIGHARPLRPAHDPPLSGRVFAGLRDDIRYGFRSIRHHPGFALMAGLALAIGIGANGAIFSIVHAVLLRKLPYPDPAALVMVWESRPREGVSDNVVSPADFLDWKARQQVFASIAAIESTRLNLTGSGEPQQLAGGHISASFFSVLGIVPALGRDFVAAEEGPGRNQVVMLSDGLWRRRFGGDPAIVGQAITLNGRSHTVIGVLPASFRFPGPAIDLWHPIDFSAENMQARFNHFLRVHARLKPGMTLDRAQREMDRISAELQREVVLQNQGHGAAVVPLAEQLVGNVRAPLLILMAAVGCVLLITGVNVANLVLARGTGRAREVAVRAALGAGRWRVVQQLVVESLCLALVGALAAVPVALWSISALRSIVPAEIPWLDGAGLDLPVMAFMAAAAVATGVAFSLVPALQLLKLDVIGALKQNGAHAGPSRRRLRRGLVVSEIALAFMLLVGAGLTTRSLFNLLDVDTGFDGDNVLTMRVALSEGEQETQARFFRELLDSVRGLPGVTAAGYGSHLPMSGDDSRSGLAVDGLVPTSDEPVRAHWRVITHGYVEAMGIRLRDGRLPTEQETIAAAPVAVINRTAAARYWPGRHPIGQRLRMLTPEWREVIGVVDDVRHLGPAAPVNPEVYLPALRNPTMLVVRAGDDPAVLTGLIRAQMRRLAPDLPLASARTMAEIQSRAVASPRFNLLLLGTFAALALVLAVVGVYGVMSYTVAQRQADVGIRMAIGASQGSVVRSFLGEGVMLTILGLALGLLGALAVTRLLTTLLFGVTPTDGPTFAAMAALLGLTAMLACYVPARRAARVDPLTALRRQ